MLAPAECSGRSWLLLSPQRELYHVADEKELKELCEQQRITHKNMRKMVGLPTVTPAGLAMKHVENWVLPERLMYIKRANAPSPQGACADCRKPRSYTRCRVPATFSRPWLPAPLPSSSDSICARIEWGVRPAASAWCPLVTVGAIPGLRAGHQVGALD